MKRINTLIATGLIAVGTVCAQAGAARPGAVRVSDEAIARSSMRLERMTSDIRNHREVPGMKQMKVKIDGVEYGAYLLSHGPAIRAAANWEWGERLYDMDFVLHTEDNSNYYSFSVLWPTWSVVNALKTPIDEDFDIDNTMVPVDDMFKLAEEGFVPFKFVYSLPGYVDIASFDENDDMDGWFMYNVSGLKGGNEMAGINKGAYLAVNALDLEKDTESVTASAEILDAAYNEKGDNNVIGSIHLTYTGPMVTKGINPRHYDFELGQVHIAYTGTYHGTDRAQGIKGNWPYYDQYFPDMKRYYINMCNKYMTYTGNQWSGKNYPHYHESSALGLGAENNPQTKYEDPEGSYAFIQGSLWVPADKNTPYYLHYSQVPTVIEYPRIVNVPEPYTTQEAWANQYKFAILDGMTGAYNGEYTDWFDVHISIGGTDGIVFTAKDNYNNTYRGTMSKGNIFFHQDPENLGPYELIPVVRPDGVEEIAGDTDSDMVEACGGVLRVTCRGEKEVSVYDAAGRTLHRTVANGSAEFAASPGLYIVKVGGKTFKAML